MTQEKIEQAAKEITSRFIEEEDQPKSFIDLWALSYQWISVDDKLPEQIEGESVSEYVFVTNGNWADVMRYEFNEKIWLDYANGRHWGITHWIKIPTLPPLRRCLLCLQVLRNRKNGGYCQSFALLNQVFYL